MSRTTRSKDLDIALKGASAQYLNTLTPRVRMRFLRAYLDALRWRVSARVLGHTRAILTWNDTSAHVLPDDIDGAFEATRRAFEASHEASRETDLLGGNLTDS